MDPERPGINPLIPRGASANFFSHFASIVNNNTRYSSVPGSLVLQEAFNHVSTFSSALIIWLGGSSNFKMRNGKASGDPNGLHNWKSNVQIKRVISCLQNFIGFFNNHQGRQKNSSIPPLIFGNVSWLSINKLCKEAEQLPFYSALSLAAALIPPFDKALADALAVPLQNDEVEKRGFFKPKAL